MVEKKIAQHTLNEIARRAGVSASTVSRVVNNVGNVKAETKERVLQAMSGHRYVPNQVARNLKRSRSNAVGMIVPDINESFFSHTVKSLEAHLSEHGYSMVLCISNEDSEKEEKYLDFLTQNMIDGVVLATVSRSSEAQRRFVDRGRSIVFIDNLPPFPEDYSAVITDNMEASRQAVQALRRAGHEKIAVITGKQSETTGRERLAGYLDEMRANGLPVRDGWVRYGDFKGESGYASMCALLEENREITAVYVHSSQMTYGAQKAIQDMGLRIPEDISLIGFDIHDNTGMMPSMITSVVQQEEEIGRLACGLLIESIEGKGTPSPRFMQLAPKLISRASVAPPRAF